MKATQILTTLALSVVATAAFAAPKPIDADKITKRTTVAYQCADGGRVSVKYGFNAAGIPVTASTKIAGATRTMKYNQRVSDNVTTLFSNAQGYKLGAEAFEWGNVRKASLSTITDSKDNIVFKSCKPRR